jgi:hypothetical protein
VGAELSHGKDENTHTNRNDEANSRFSQSSECVHKLGANISYRNMPVFSETNTHENHKAYVTLHKTLAFSRQGSYQSNIIRHKRRENPNFPSTVTLKYNCTGTLFYLTHIVCQAIPSRLWCGE